MDLPTMYRCKLVVVGESGVGKSLLIRHLISGVQLDIPEATVGASFYQKTVVLDNFSVLFDIWDTAGQERFRSVGRMYYRGAEAAIVMYDVTDKNSFSAADYWISELRENAQNLSTIILVGNKIDKENQIVVSTQEGKQKADRGKLLFLEASAQNGHNVEAIFRQVATELRHNTSLSSNNNDVIRVFDTRKRKNKKCSSCG